LDTLQAERVDLLREQAAAMQEVERANLESLLARESLEAIQNPFAVRNVVKWLAEKGPKLLVILIGVLVIHLLVNLLTGRVVTFLAGKETHGRKKDRERRANALVGVFHSSSILINYAGGTLAILDVAGLPIAPLLGGAAVAGLAVAFAAQSLIKDYFCGFIILLEDQYSVNDVIRIGSITGLVERVTLRVTVVRDLEAVHFIPHGQIASVSNLTHKWSRAVFDVGVAYGENVDDVMEVIIALGKEMREDPEFGPLILEDMEMLGLDSFGDSSIVIKFFIKTRPLKQWAVRREFNRRIKNKFDELGIEIPFPHRTVYHRMEENQSIHSLEQLGKHRGTEAA
jgi:small conductance mechanosensitive channel